jgi:hypothetical protein
MALSSTDPVTARSLWLQLRSSRRKSRRPQWRSDWTPVWILLVLMSILALSLLMIPSIDVMERVDQAAKNGAVAQQPPLFGALAEP